jgi:hypothetical protein
MKSQQFCSVHQLKDRSYLSLVLILQCSRRLAGCEKLLYVGSLLAATGNAASNPDSSMLHQTAGLEPDQDITGFPHCKHRSHLLLTGSQENHVVQAEYNKASFFAQPGSSNVLAD